MHKNKRQYGLAGVSQKTPHSKNATYAMTTVAISKVFRENGLADELESGMRNTYKYTRLYSGGVPQFMEGDIFKTIIPLNETATMKSGPKNRDQVGNDTVTDEILEFCRTART